MKKGISLRPYQQKAISLLYEWFNHHDGNPCVVMPTGSGKSHVIAAFCKESIQAFPDTRILMLTHVKELIAQNAEKLRQHWPNAPLGIYSAGLKQKDIDQITYAGIQSIRRKPDILGHIDLVLVDECHLISHKDVGGYRTLISKLKENNPALKVIGFTATPFRLGHGLITDDPAIFDDIIKPTSIEELQYHGHLSKLRSKITHKHILTDGVHKRGGEYIEKELQQAVDTKDNNLKVVKESIALASRYEREHWLFFCVGIAHSEHVCELLIEQGIESACISSKTPPAKRDEIINDFKSGKIKALTNPNILTTGFDYPDIDMIVMMRPTMSPVLYVQMAGRGLRLKSHTDHCLVLDFAGVVQQHGPITNVNIPRKSGGGGVAPSKICPECDEIIFAGLKVCSECGFIFPPPEKDPLSLHDDDIQGDGSKSMEVTSWRWSVQESKKNSIEMLVVTYYGGLMDKPIREYLCVLHGGWVGYKAMENLKSIAVKSGADIMTNSLEDLCKELEESRYPSEVVYKKDGRYNRVIDRIFGEQKVMLEQAAEEEEEIIWF